MMYLSTALGPGPHLRTVLAHEYTHAVTFSAKALAAAADCGRPAVEEEGWLDEGLAHLAEDLHGFSRSNLDYRVSAFLSRPERYRLVVEDYYAADLFRSHGNRGGTYLFLRWCADRYGPGLLPALVRSERPRGREPRGRDRRGLRGPVPPVVDRPVPGRARIRPRPRPGRGVPLARSPRDVRRLGAGRPADDPRAAGRPGRHLVGGRHEQPLRGGRGVVRRRGRPSRSTARPEADLQVTAIPLPADLARLDLTARASARARRRPPPPRPGPRAGRHPGPALVAELGAARPRRRPPRAGLPPRRPRPPRDRLGLRDLRPQAPRPARLRAPSDSPASGAAAAPSSSSSSAPTPGAAASPPGPTSSRPPPSTRPRRPTSPSTLKF